MSEIMLEKRQRSLLSPNFTCRKQVHSRNSGTIGDRKHDSLMQRSLFSVASLVTGKRSFCLHRMRVAW
ncbi:hypothetical protein [Paenibacillus thalictri]|uniref:hypothetical protein n=1 Tax=Paenibacillus thalictri TaxID=2527873 RepID=UPI0013EEEA99|nr:hypothetical protein [Paenibacillus thalictri]